MPHAFMDSTGFKIAKAGFDARTAAEINLLFSSSASSLAQYVSGVAASAGLTLGPNDDRYHHAIINFGKTYTTPPLVFFGAKYADGLVNTSIGFYNAGSGYLYANIFAVTSTTQAKLYALARYGTPTGFHYFIMENTIQ